MLFDDSYLCYMAVIFAFHSKSDKVPLIAPTCNVARGGGGCAIYQRKWKTQNQLVKVFKRPFTLENAETYRNI